MHKFVKWIFETLINIEKFLRVVCIFLIMLLALYWVQNLIGASWWWMGFMAPILDFILDFVNSIYSFSFDFSGKTIEIKYFNAVLLMFIVICGLKAINFGIEKLYELYEDAHFLYKKTNEKVFNNNLNNSIKFEEKKLTDYKLYIQTKFTKKYANKPMDTNIEEYNNRMNKFITDNTNNSPITKWDGFVYSFNDFEKIDIVLELLFKILNSELPIDYIMCIQIGNDTTKLKQLVDLQEWNKITMSADTLCRYEYNDIKNYKTTSVGIFQKEYGTLEVHEFVEKL